MIRFYALRLFRDYIGHLILIGLPVVLIYILVSINTQHELAPSTKEAALYIGFIYIIMFQGFGAAYTFEGLEHDFYSPFKSRLLAAPINPAAFVWANIFFSSIVSFIQSLVIMTYIIVVFNVTVNNLALVVIVLLLGVILAQLLGAILIFYTKKASIAQAVLIFYIILTMMIAGFFMPLPEHGLTEFLEKYSSPLTWINHSIHSIMEGQFSDSIITVSLLIGTIALLMSLVIYKSKQVVQ